MPVFDRNEAILTSCVPGVRRSTRAGDGIRTHDNNVGNVVLCQLSYTRNSPRRQRLGINHRPCQRLK